MMRESQTRAPNVWSATLLRTSRGQSPAKNSRPTANCASVNPTSRFIVKAAKPTLVRSRKLMTYAMVRSLSTRRTIFLNAVLARAATSTSGAAPCGAPAPLQLVAWPDTILTGHARLECRSFRGRRSRRFEQLRHGLTGRGSSQSTAQVSGCAAVPRRCCYRLFDRAGGLPVSCSACAVPVPSEEPRG